MISSQYLDDVHPVPAPTSREDHLSQGTTPKTTKTDTSSQTKFQMHYSPNRSHSATFDPEQHDRNPIPETSATLPSGPEHSLVPSVVQTGMERTPSHNTRMDPAAVPQGNVMSGSPSVQNTWNVINNYTIQTSDLSQSTEFYESQPFPQLLLDSLQPLDLEDWTQLASYLKLDKFIVCINSNVKNHGKSATQLLMDKWWQSRGRNANMGEIKDALKKMTRIDVLDEFSDVLEEWEKQNN